LAQGKGANIDWLQRGVCQSINCMMDNNALLRQADEIQTLPCNKEALPLLAKVLLNLRGFDHQCERYSCQISTLIKDVPSRNGYCLNEDHGFLLTAYLDWS
jgi:hypothetical protein